MTQKADKWFPLRTTNRWQIATVVVLILLEFSIWILPWAPVRYGVSFVLLWVLPGIAWALLIPQGALRRIEWLVVGLGLGFVVTPVTLLLISYVPGPVTEMQLLLATAIVVGLPVLLSAVMRQGRQDGPERGATHETGTWRSPSSRLGLRPWQGWVWLAAPVLIATALRGVNLNYSEFQGDEAIVMMRAARALEGDESAVLGHRKGPTELAVVMGGWRLTGILNEGMARLPFAWASILALIAAILVCCRIESWYLGSVTGLLLAIEGYWVAFGRVVQYQSVVLVLTALALLCWLVYYREGNRSLILVGVVLFAGGLLAHYDAILAVPAGLLLLGARVWRERQRAGRTAVSLLSGLLLGLVLVGVFYVPYYLSPTVSRTSSYLAHRLGSGFFNNLPTSFWLSAVYDSIYLLGVLLLALCVTLLLTWAEWGRLGWLVGACLLVGTLLGIWWPDIWLVGGSPLAWVPFAVLVLGAFLAPNQRLERRAIWLLFGVPATFYLFVVEVPKTHVHTFFAAWAILAGMGLLEVGTWLRARTGAVRGFAYGLGLMLCALSGLYAVIVFLDHSPEYRRAFPESKLSIYWAPYEEVTLKGLYGFPYQAGWKVVGVLADTGLLGENYNSNEEPAVTKYYARQVERWECPSPDVYVTAINVQDEMPIRWDQVEADYRPAIQATVGGEPKLTILRRSVAGAVATYPVEVYARKFDQLTTPEHVASSAPSRTVAVPETYEDHAYVVGDFARLIGHRVETSDAVPGGFVDVVLLWEVLKTPTKDYTVFTHLYADGQMWGQLDSQPGCGRRPTTSWRRGEIVLDPYRIPVKNDAPAGAVPVIVGMYDLGTLDRVKISTDDGFPLGDSMQLDEVILRVP